MNCLLYARVSTDRQAEQSSSIPAQIDAMQRYAKAQGWTVVDVITDAGESARSADRPGLQSLLARCRKDRNIGAVVVHKIDRLARNLEDHAVIRALLRRHEVRLASVVESVDDSVAGRLLENIMASIAEFYSANLGQEIRKGQSRSVAEGRWPHQPPRGYRSSTGPDGRPLLIPDPTKTPAIRRMFERYATGVYSLGAIAAAAHAEGFVTGSGKPLSSKLVAEILDNPVYAGRLRWRGSDYAGRHEAIVSPQLFADVRRLRQVRTGRRIGASKHRFLLRGLAYCAQCQRRMTAQIQPGGSYYHCYAPVQRRHEKCDAPYAPTRIIEAELADAYRGMKLAPEIVEAVVGRIRSERTERANRARKERASLRSRAEAVERMLAGAAEGFASRVLSEEAYRPLAVKYEAELRTTRETLASLQAAGSTDEALLESIVRLTGHLDVLHQSLPWEKQVVLSSVLFERIWVHDGHIVYIEPRPPFDGLLKSNIVILFEKPEPGATIRYDLEYLQCLGEIDPSLRTILQDEHITHLLAIQDRSGHVRLGRHHVRPSTLSP